MAQIPSLVQSPDAGYTKEQLIATIDALVHNFRPYIRSAFLQMADSSAENASILCDHIIAEQNERNIAETTQESKIKVLIWVSQKLGHKSYREMTKQDILSYLNSLRKPESSDPKHRWIGTWNNRVLILNKFFRWLYNPDEPDFRRRPTPPCMNGIKQLPRKEKSPYKPADLWTIEEHVVFLKYCPSPRDRCYHAMAHDTSARPHELLGLKIKDILFKLAPDGRQYAEVLVSGKTKQRTLPLIASIPYVKEWIHAHPFGANQNAYLFVSLAPKSFGQKMKSINIWWQYNDQFRQQHFPRLLKDPTVPPEDKQVIAKLLAKPWNPYIQRHTALTEKSQILKESTLRDHAGWSMTSKMPAVYVHYFGTESSNSLLEAYGIIKDDKQKQLQLLQPKMCPNCNEPNKREERFCISCKMVLTYDAYRETLQKEEHMRVGDGLELKALYDEIQELRRELFKRTSGENMQALPANSQSRQ